MVNTAYRKTSLHRDRPNLEPAVERARSHGIGLARRGASTALRKPMPRDDADECPAPRAYPFFTMSRNPPLGSRQNCCLFEFGRFPLEVWWSQTGSNRRPPACKAGALPTELWPRLDLATQAGRHLPGDLKRRSSHRALVGLERFELSTSRLSSARSNQLSYRPGKRGGRPNEERETKAAVSRRHFAEPV